MRKFQKLARLLGKKEWRHGMRSGVAASVEHNAFLATHPFATVLDVGANHGQFSLAVKGFWPQARIVAFEPLPGAADHYERLFAGDASVSLVRAALGNSKRNAQIHVSRKSHSSSLLPIGELQNEIFPGTAEVGLTEVPVVRFDDVVDVATLARPVLLKIDVQGSELEVLEGCERSLAVVDEIYIEVSFIPLYIGQTMAHEVVAWLADRGFGLTGIYHLEFDRHGRSVQSDLHLQRVRPPSESISLAPRRSSQPV